MILSMLLVLAVIQFAAIVLLGVSNFKLWVEIKAFHKSTHQIVMPTALAGSIAPAFESQDDATKKSMSEAFNDYVGIN
jgi:serine protease inhibitor